MGNNKPTLATLEEIADAIRLLKEKDLRFLNRLIVDRLKLISQARSTVTLSNFQVGDQVSFLTSTGDMRTGMITRINKKTASVTTFEGERWNVHPGFLTIDGHQTETVSPGSRLLEDAPESDG